MATPSPFSFARTKSGMRHQSCALRSLPLAQRVGDEVSRVQTRCPDSNPSVREPNAGRTYTSDMPARVGELTCLRHLSQT